MSKTLAILGSRHLGRQIANIAISDNQYERVVFFDDFTKEKQVNGFKILGTSNEIVSEFDRKSFDKLIIGIGYNHLSVRKEMFDRFNNIVPFATIIHSSCVIDESAQVKDGCVIYPCCCVDTNTIIENNTIVNIACTIAHDCLIGKHSFLSPRVAIAGFVELGEQCFLGINSTIIDNVKVFDNIQLGGGTIVIKNIKDRGLYVGNPARFVK
jgi:sugar O-acyltransferase (sialic acid O-acetyltransferase NeuD family)